LVTIAKKPNISDSDFEAATRVVDRVLQVHVLLEHFTFLFLDIYLPCYYIGSHNSLL
jgi:hypothetical protein